MSQHSGFERRLEFDDSQLARDLFGPHNENVALIADKSGARIDTRGNTATLRATSKEAVSHAASVLVQLYGILRKGQPVGQGDVERALTVLAREPEASLTSVFAADAVAVSPKKAVTPSPSPKKNTFPPSGKTISSSASAPPAREKPIWPWPWPSPPCSTADANAWS